MRHPSQWMTFIHSHPFYGFTEWPAITDGHNDGHRTIWWWQHSRNEI